MLWLNGSLADDDDARISPRDLGFLHGAGVFTTMRAADGRAWQLPRHLARIRASADALAIALTYSDDDLTAAAAELLDAVGGGDRRMRLTLTRGTAFHDGERLVVEPTALLTADPHPFAAAGELPPPITAVLLDQWKLNPYDPQAGHKTTDYLSRFAAMQYAQQRGGQEAIWFNVHHVVQSASLGNLFLVRDGKLFTPPTQTELTSDERMPRSNVLPGTMRAAVIDAADAAGIDVVTLPFGVDELLAAEEAFITNSLILAMPIGAFEGHRIGDGAAGPITRRLAGAVEEMLRSSP